MKGKRFTDEQITYALRQAKGGTPVAYVCRQMGVSEASFYTWERKYGKLDRTSAAFFEGIRATTEPTAVPVRPFPGEHPRRLGPSFRF